MSLWESQPESAKRQGFEDGKITSNRHKIDSRNTKLKHVNV